MADQQTPLTDEFLKSIDGIAEAEPKDFFYARLTAKMAKQQKEWIFPLKPAWMVACLVLLLLINTFILIEKSKASGTEQIASIEGFANAFSQNSYSY